MTTMGDILGTVGDVQYHGRYHDTVDIMSTVGGCHFLLFEYLHSTENPHSTHGIFPHVS